jgi:DNA polymerase-3 subunit epsilon
MWAQPTYTASAPLIFATHPSFEEVLGDVAMRLDGAVLVGHNVRFDLGFLVAEFSRVGFSMPSTPALCTLRLAYLLEPSLEDIHEVGWLR